MLSPTTQPPPLPACSQRSTRVTSTAARTVLRVAWTYYGRIRTWARKVHRTGKGETIFERILERLESRRSIPTASSSRGHFVIFGSEAGIVKATGQPFRNEWCQSYVVEGSLIVEMVEYNIQFEPRS